MASYKAGAGNLHDEPGTSLLPESQEVLKTKRWRPSKGHKKQPERAPSG